tara:strand:- start:507 stop:722 length:216 start_codon:yes stop_codon:yes gene_type:complete
MLWHTASHTIGVNGIVLENALVADLQIRKQKTENKLHQSPINKKALSPQDCTYGKTLPQLNISQPIQSVQL